MRTPLRSRPLCLRCKKRPSGMSERQLCQLCVTAQTCCICKRFVPEKAGGSWCEDCVRMMARWGKIMDSFGYHRPDDETLAYRLQLYATRASNGLPLFDPRPLF